MCRIVVTPHACGHSSAHVLMVCHAPLVHYDDSFDDYCARPKVQYLTKEMAVGYECAVCMKLVVKKVEAGTGELKENEKKGASHANAKRMDPNATSMTYTDESYLEDEFDAWQVGLGEAVFAKGKNKENARRESSVGRRGSKDHGGRSSSISPRKGSKNHGSKGDDCTDTRENVFTRTSRNSTFHDRDRSSASYDSGRRSSILYSTGRSSTPYGSSRPTAI